MKGTDDSPVAVDLPLEQDTRVSFAELKIVARPMLPPESALRDLILSEPDLLPWEAAALKVKMYLKPLRRELNGTHALG